MTPAEAEANACLEAELMHRSLVESVAGNATRRAVITLLEALMCKAVAQLAAARGVGIADAADSGARLLPFGSFREAVHSPSSDLDLLALCPAYCDRTDFFATLPPILRNAGGVGVSVLSEAFVPVIKLMMRGIAVDVLFARVPLTRIPPDFDALKEEALALRLAADDAKSSVSLNGVRVTEAILASIGRGGAVPAAASAAVATALSAAPSSHAGRYEPQHTFRIALITVKAWARARGIYGHMLGYLGGVNWALLVATLCKGTPTSSGPSVVDRGPLHVRRALMFSIQHYKWPTPWRLDTSIPVLATWKAAATTAAAAASAVAAATADTSAAAAAEAASAMPIMTPCRPTMDSAHNVTRDTLAVIQAEAARAQRIIDAVLSSGPAVAPAPSSSAGNDIAAPATGASIADRVAAGIHALLEPAPFQDYFPLYVRVAISYTRRPLAGAATALPPHYLSLGRDSPIGGAASTGGNNSSTFSASSAQSTVSFTAPSFSAAASDSADTDHSAEAWFGWVESRLRHLPAVIAKANAGAIATPSVAVSTVSSSTVTSQQSAVGATAGTASIGRRIGTTAAPAPTTTASPSLIGSSALTAGAAGVSHEQSSVSAVVMVASTAVLQSATSVVAQSPPVVLRAILHPLRWSLASGDATAPAAKSVVYYLLGVVPSRSTTSLNPSSDATPFSVDITIALRPWLRALDRWPHRNAEHGVAIDALSAAGLREWMRASGVRSEVQDAAASSSAVVTTEVPSSSTARTGRQQQQHQQSTSAGASSEAASAIFTQPGRNSIAEFTVLIPLPGATSTSTSLNLCGGADLAPLLSPASSTAGSALEVSEDSMASFTGVGGTREGPQQRTSLSSDVVQREQSIDDELSANADAEAENDDADESTGASPSKRQRGTSPVEV